MSSTYSSVVGGGGGGGGGGGSGGGSGGGGGGSGGSGGSGCSGRSGRGRSFHFVGHCFLFPVFYMLFLFFHESFVLITG